MKKIYGFIRKKFENGVDAIVIDGDTKEIIASHFCSSVGFAKSDLGFSEPYMRSFGDGSNDLHSTVVFNNERKDEYNRLYPDGYKLIWVNDPYTQGLIKN